MGPTHLECLPGVDAGEGQGALEPPLEDAFELVLGAAEELVGGVAQVGDDDVHLTGEGDRWERER